MQKSSQDFLWIQIDNGFCVIYYAIIAVMAAFKKMYHQNQDVLLGPSIVFNLVLIMNHLFMIMVFKYIYDHLKDAENRLENIDENSLDYREVIQKEREKLIDNYEVPVSLQDDFKIHSSHANPKPDFLRELSHRIKGLQNDKKETKNSYELIELKNEEVIYADIIQESEIKIEPRNSDEKFSGSVD